MRMGHWDSTYDVLQDISHQQQEEKTAAQTVATTGPITIDFKPSALTDTKVTMDSPKGTPVFLNYALIEVLLIFLLPYHILTNSNKVQSFSE